MIGDRVSYLAGKGQVRVKVRVRVGLTVSDRVTVTSYGYRL